MRISDWSSDVCSSDLLFGGRDHIERDAGLAPHPPDQLVAIDGAAARLGRDRARQGDVAANQLVGANRERGDGAVYRRVADPAAAVQPFAQANDAGKGVDDDKFTIRSEEHTSEIQSLMRISYAVFCFRKKKSTIELSNTH